MLLPYATVKPHDAAECPHCGPRGQGHHRCQNGACPGRDENNGAGRVATMQTRRHATEQEYAALPLGLLPIDGVAHQAVFACDECAEDAFDPFCGHPEPQPIPCPACGVADPTAPCLKKDGKTPLGFRHSGRVDPRPEMCTHAHRPDCSVFDGCQCTGDDQPPQRPAHPAADGHSPDVSRLLFDEATAQMLLLGHGIHWWQVREVRSVWTQDTKPALQAEYAALDDAGHIRFDEHGHEVLKTVVIPIVAPDRPQE